MTDRKALPLEGVRVLAIEQMQAMPFATQLLSHLGAEIVKVEHPKGGESGRSGLPSLTDVDGRQAGATFMRNNLGKKSLAIDLKDPKGVELVKKLVPHYDVVAENFKPGTMERLGLGYDVLEPLHPGLIYVAVSGFGSLLDTPYGHWPAYAVLPEAMGGFYSFRPEPGRKPNIQVAGALGDISSSLFAAIGMLAALQGRNRTGLGQKVDVAMLDCIIAMMDMVPFNHSLGIDNSVKAWPGILSSYEARDGLFVMQVGREHQFERLAHTLGRPEWLQDPRFATREGWRDHAEDVVRPAVEEWASDKTKLEASERLAAAGIVAGPSYEAADLLEDPHVQSHDMILRIPRPDGEGEVHVSGNPVKLSHSEPKPVERWPALGRDTDDVLRADLGLADSDLSALRDAGVIG